MLKDGDPLALAELPFNLFVLRGLDRLRGIIGPRGRLLVLRSYSVRPAPAAFDLLAFRPALRVHLRVRHLWSYRVEVLLVNRARNLLSSVASLIEHHQLLSRNLWNVVYLEIILGLVGLRAWLLQLLPGQDDVGDSHSVSREELLEVAGLVLVSPVDLARVLAARRDVLLVVSLLLD